jgi:hypothetical protein
MTKTLYETDFALWAETQASHLYHQDWSAIDWENTSEEIAALGRSEKHELENRLEVLLEHLLKRCYLDSPENYRGWELTIKEQRKQLRRLLRSSPSLKQYWQQIFEEIWQDALSDVRDLYPIGIFPEECPFPHDFPTDLDAMLSVCFWNA